MLERMWRKENSYVTLMRVEMGNTTLKNHWEHLIKSIIAYLTI